MLENIRNRFQFSEKPPLFSENKMQAQSQGGVERVQEGMERRTTHIGYGLGVGLRRYFSVFSAKVSCYFRTILRGMPFFNSFLERQQTEIQCYLEEHSSPNKYAVHQLKDFTFFAPKGKGISKGGIYKDSKEDLWLIKQSYYHGYVIKEFIAGEIYRLFLGERAPVVVLVHDREKNRIL